MADDDDYNPDALDEEGAQDDDGFTYEPTKERVIALIDADVSMLDTLEEGGEARSYLCWAVDLVAGIMQERIRLSPRDEFGILFYSTVNKSRGADRTHEHVYEYLPLEAPSARSIRWLAAFSDAEFQAGPGCSDVSQSPGRAAEDLKGGLLLCWDMFTRSAGGAAASANAAKHSRVAKSVLVFTNNSNPLQGAADAQHAKDQLDVRAQELGSLAAHMEVIPLIQLADPAAFDFAAFWSPLLSEARSMAATLAAAAGAGGDAWEADELADLADEAEDIETKIMRVKGLGLRSSTGRKRPLNALHWTLGPGFSIAVKLYGLVMLAKKPHHTYVTAAANTEVTKTRAYVDMDTGAMLPEVRYRSFEADARGGGAVGRFPKVVLRNEEVSALKALRPKGLTLLGFKPAACLADHHTLGPSRFVYPDERSLRGSTAAFVALHAACLEDEDDPQMPVCSYVSRPGAMPQLVALLPQQEELDGDTQVTPPGFHLIFLPFKDDLRSPESDPALVSRVTAGHTAPPRANAEQVAAAVAVLGALSIDTVDEEGAPDPFSSTLITNPALERHFQVLEALALDEPLPGMEELEDDTEPDMEGMAAHRRTMDAFKVAVFGSADGPPEKAKAAAKRKADDPAVQRAVAEEYASHDWAALAAPGAKPGLCSLTVPTLRVYLQHHGLRLTGNKADVMERICEHLAGVGAAGPAGS